MTKQQILGEIKARLAAKCGDRLCGAILCGSEARGQAGPESDIDVLVLLDGPIDYGPDLETNLEALYPLSLQIGRRITAKPVEAEEFKTVDCPLYREARLQGISA